MVRDLLDCFVKKQSQRSGWRFLQLILIAPAVTFMGCSGAVKNASDDVVAVVEVSNPSSSSRVDEPLYWSFYDLGLTDKTKTLSLWRGDKIVPSQIIDVDGDGRVDGLFALLDFNSGQTYSVTIKSTVATAASMSKRTQAEISVKVGGEWTVREEQPDPSRILKNYVGGHFENRQKVSPPSYYEDHSFWIRYEGPGIESDKVAYRVYLDRRNGFDIFGKLTPDVTLQNIGLDGYDSYHSPQSWGMDILKVGPTLGSGGFGAWENNKVIPVENVGQRTATIANNGDLFSSFNIDYTPWNINGRSVNARAHMSMYGGSRLVKNTLSFDKNMGPLAIGFVIAKDAKLIEGNKNIPGDAFTYLASWGKQSLAGDNLGMAVFYRKTQSKGIANDGLSNIVVMAPQGKEVEYYFAAAWQQEGGDAIDSETKFKAYLDETATRLSKPIRTRVKTAATHTAIKKIGNVADESLYFSKAMADSELKRKALGYHAGGWDVNRKRAPRFEYDIVGLLPFAYDELATVTGQKKYANVKHQVTASFVQDNGAISAYDINEFNIDAVAPGRPLLRVYKEAPKEKYRLALLELRKQLEKQPKTSNGAFWHKQKYPGQLWLDGVYMGMPYLTEYTLAFENGHALDEVEKEFMLTQQLLRDPKTGMYHHAWDELKAQHWANKKTGLSPEYWSRGMGWLAMALVDVIELLPEDQQEMRAKLSAMSVDFAKTLKTYRDPTGTWWQIMDKANHVGNYRESSASAMFVYFFAKAARLGILTDENFGSNLDAFIASSYQGLVDEFILVHADGTISMTNQCLVAGLGFGRDGSYDYYMTERVFENDPKGTGPFILAGIEVNKQLKK